MSDYYVCHDAEKGLIWRGIKQPVPEIFWLKNLSIPLTSAWQRLIYDMNQPGMTPKNFRGFLGKRTAVANSGGFPGDSEKDKRADFINRIDLDAPLPRLGKTYIFGGAKIHGTLKDGWLIVETLDGTKPPPKWADMKAKPWLYSRALIVKADGSTFDFPYRDGAPVLFPLVGIGVIKIKIRQLVKDKPIPYIIPARQG